MMSDPDSGYALRAALRDRLIANQGVAAIIAGRVYTQAPQGVAFPHLVLGEAQDLPFEDGGCINGVETYLTLHGWTRSQKAASEAILLNAAVKLCLHNQIFPLSGHVLQSMRVPSARVMRDPDGITWHGVITVHAYTTAL